MQKTPEQVAYDHVAAVESGDPAAMAADYGADAKLERPGQILEGRPAIEEYFQTVPQRLGSAVVVFDRVIVDGNTVTFVWHLAGAQRPVSGRDVCIVDRGAIVSQVVTLDADDF